MLQSQSIEIYLGVDVSKSWVDVCALHAADQRVLFEERVPRTAAALTAVAQRLDAPTVAVLEGTGRLEALPARALEAAGVGAVVVNPAQARHFALGRGLLEKSDKIDARMLAELGRERRFQPRMQPDPAVEELALLTVRRRQMVSLRAVERTRLRAETLEYNRESLRLSIENLSVQVERIEQEIRRRIRSEEALEKRFKLLLSAPGIGETTAAELIGLLPELGHISRGAVAKLVGVAPLIKQSGRWRGRVMTIGGRAPVRSALYMAALSAVRSHTYFRDRYLSMTARGKLKKVALIAMARQLLTVLNRMLREERMFDPTALFGPTR